MVGPKSSWNIARCNRLLRPLSSKIALLRKTTLSEPRHDDYNAGIALPSSSQTLTATAKVEDASEISPRAWKRIKRTYSSRTNGQFSRRTVGHDTDRALKEERNAVIQLPSHLTTGRAVDHDKDLTIEYGQRDLSAQRGASRADRSTQKNAETFHGPQTLSCAISTGLSNRRLIEGICKALEALLRATTSEKTCDNGGPRSLFSVCLRQIPNYIAEEQRLTNGEDPENDIDVASEVYTDLEAFGSASDGGWESLREVVRAHGLSLVREAIQEGLIEFSLSHHILSLCLGLAAYDEAECVIESMIARVKSRPLPSKRNTGLCAGLSHTVNKWATSHPSHAALLTNEASRVVGALTYFVAQSGRHGFMYRQLAAMLEHNILPIHWTSSKVVIECWNGVIRSITQQDDHAQSAALLLQTAVSKSYKRGVSKAKANPHVHDLRLRAREPTNLRPSLRSYKSGQTVEMIVEGRSTRSGEAGAQPDDKEKALQATFSNILTVLSTINILRSPKWGLDSDRPDLLSLALMRDMALEIRQALEIASITSYTNCTWSVPAEQLHLPLLSAGLVSVVSRSAGTDISQSEVLELAALASVPFNKELVCNAGSFLCEVARCCDEAQSGDGFRFAQVMVQDLIAIAISDSYDQSTRKFCSGIAHAAAFAFSEDTGQPKHLDWALDVEGTITRTTDDSPKVILDKTPARAVMRSKSGYKWEDGICEWIAKTPALALQRPTATKDGDRNSTGGEARKFTLVQEWPLRSGISPCNTDRRLPRPKRESGGRGSFCDVRSMENVKASYRNSISSEELLFISVSPRPQKISRLQSLWKADAADDLDELSTPDPPGENPIVLREIPNAPSGVTRKSFGRKHKDKVIGGYELDMPATKRRCLDKEAFLKDTDDELGLP